MNALELNKMKVPQLRELAKSKGIHIPKRWLKPQIVEAIAKALNTSETAQDDYSDFLGDDSKPVEVEEVETAETDAEPEPAGRGGARPGAGRPPGTDADHMKMKRANSVQTADINLKNMVIGCFKFRKKDTDEELAENAAKSYTKVGEYFGVMERIRNTPAWIFGQAAFYTYKLVIYLFGKNPDDTSADNNDIRTQGDGQDEPGQAPNPAV